MRVTVAVGSISDRYSATRPGLRSSGFWAASDSTNAANIMCPTIENAGRRA
jgi:hypothetical protein